ncbi:hypothetical protein AAFF_G00183900 [Aldrovandia affinis]|uniref:Transmembrane protein 42 n=1 Tax=Aldrovandia affinis TaxID=143900 RepID=A0AAD7W6K7_9TELE|nr:hypothetical protein AAFF_G00183900 [Aldrovandia affinis]
MFPGVFYALLAGFLGAVASSSAKLSLGADYLKGVCETGLKSWGGEERKFRQADETTACDWLHIPLRLLCGGLLFTCNAVMWTFFSKALRYSSSSARATVTTTASNFISSAFLGQLIFTLCCGGWASPSRCPGSWSCTDHRPTLPSRPAQRRRSERWGARPPLPQGRRCHNRIEEHASLYPGDPPLLCEIIKRNESRTGWFSSTLVCCDIVCPGNDERMNSRFKSVLPSSLCLEQSVKQAWQTGVCEPPCSFNTSPPYHRAIAARRCRAVGPCVASPLPANPTPWDSGRIHGDDLLHPISCPSARLRPQSAPRTPEHAGPSVYSPH